MHLLNYGESPLIVAVASAVKPELSALKAGERWGHDLLLDTLAGNDQPMVEILAKTIYAAGVPFDAVVSEPSSITPVPTIAGAFAFKNGPVTFARFGTSINGQFGMGLDPIVMTSDIYASERRAADGVSQRGALHSQGRRDRDHCEWSRRLLAPDERAAHRRAEGRPGAGRRPASNAQHDTE